MCGRYTASLPTQQVADELSAELMADMPARFNVAPTQPAPVVTMRTARQLGAARFGLVPSDSDGPKDVKAKYINLRSEGLTKQKRFVQSAQTRRCLVVSDGFYEWDKTQPKGLPWHIHPKDGGLMTFAGVWDVWVDPDTGEKLPSFAILTTAANEELSEIHSRMPLVVPASMRDAWLDPSDHDARALIHALRDAGPGALEKWRVDPRVGNVRNDEPELREPIEP